MTSLNDNRSSNGVLIEAVRNRSIDVVRKLLEQGVNPNESNVAGESPLCLAILGRCEPGIITALLESGARPDSPDVSSHRCRRTVLHLAIELMNRTCVEALLRAGADVTIADSEGWTPLHYAAASGDAMVANLLLQYGAKANRWSHTGQSPLLLAASRQHVGIVESLFHCGASLEVKNPQGDTLITAEAMKTIASAINRPSRARYPARSTHNLRV
jgi:uncharacterized protein